MVALFGISCVMAFFLFLFAITAVREREPKWLKCVSFTGFAVFVAVAIIVALHTKSFCRTVYGVRFVGEATIFRTEGTATNTNDFPVTIQVLVEKGAFTTRLVECLALTLKPQGSRPFSIWAGDFIQITQGGELRAMFPIDALCEGGD